MAVKLRLSQIKLAGFKSFVDPTHIELPGQIVGVVGPNGCGKSNVIDALRWVLGESKASALRGESMQDVIFNGSGKRRPVARASVELVFDNALGKAAGQWASFAEISIKRILQRNGESSYYINNQKVRRRDITDIFLGTGLGARAYAIIEQGMISRIIEAKPEELRVFLEEAAGVSRYRERRRETALRLNDTRDNLLRIGDILLEMEAQLARLGVQAEVARQYRELEQQRNTAQQLLWLVKKQEAAALREGFTQNIGQTRIEMEAQTARLREIESQLETGRSRHYQLSDALHAKQGDLYSANAQIAQLEQQIKQAAQQQQRVAQQIANTERQIEQQQQQRNTAQRTLEDWQRQQEEAGFKLEFAAERAEQESENLPQAEAVARAAQERYNTQQREQLKLQQQLQLAGTQSANLQRNIVQLENRALRLTQERDALPSPDHDTLQQAVEEAAELEMQQAEQQEQLALLQEQLPEAEARRAQQRILLQQHERQQTKTEARLHALQTMQRQLDSDKPLQEWLRQHRLDQLPRLWQSIRIANGWENALEAVLRERLNALALPTLANALDYAPPARVALFVPGELSDAGINSELQHLLAYVECQDNQVLPALHEWLANVFAVEEVAMAYRLREALPPGGWFVTPEGHLIGQHSLLLHAPDSQLHGVLTRQREIEQLDSELIENNQIVISCKSALIQVEQDCRTIEQQMPPLRSTLTEIQRRGHALQLQILKLTGQHERCAERSLQIAQELRDVESQLEMEQEQRQVIAMQMEIVHEEAETFHLQLEEARHRAGVEEKQLREQRERVQQAQHALREAQFFTRTCQDKITDLHQTIELITDTLMQSEENLAQLHMDLSGSVDELAQMALQDALQVRQVAEQTLSEARNALEGATASLQQSEQARLSCEHQLNGLRERLGTLALKEQESRLYYEQWAEKLQEVDEGALLPLLKSAKPSALQNELNRLNKQIDELGAVNLAALDELNAATERKAYLDAQAQDLQQAMATLEEAIRHIDSESRDLLMETYRKVNEQLAELFPVLFAGGEAKLVLTGEEILDSGFQVMAQPPGKKNSTIHLLSGGEKALTAIALIFSLFRLNPAPFCLLDEVDAPLDDTNTERLCALIRKMAEHTQFVFISHNKIAMEMAQQLIGVTMQEKGVSKVVSVDIEAALRMRDEAVAV